MLPRVVDQDLPHHARGNPIEMRAPFPCDIRLHQPEIGFVDKGGRLQCMVRSLAPHAPGSYAAQFPLDRADQTVVRRATVFTPPAQQARHVRLGKAFGHQELLNPGKGVLA